MGDFVKTNDQQLRARLALFIAVGSALPSALGLTALHSRP